uniref:YfhO family protein n=1 Tax=Solibacter usitatus (strain Ellin6076) TaxID=234267 RepID=Q01X59_SOLUE
MERQKRSADAVALLVIAACITIAFWKIALTSQYTFIESPDIGHQVLPWLQVQAAALHRGVAPLWDPYLIGGQPLPGQLQPAVFSPFTWILLAAPLDSAGHIHLGWIHGWFVLLHVFAGVFAYGFLRDLGVRREACVVGAVFFGAAGFVGNTPWPQIAAGAIWLPLVFLFFLRSLRGERALFNAALAGGFLGLSFLSGHHAVPTFASLALIGVSLGAALARRLAWTAALARTAITLVVAACGAAVQILPALEYAHYAVRWVNATNPVGWRDVIPYTVHQALGWSASELLFAVLPGSTNNIVNPLVGIVPLTLAAIALLERPWRRGAGLFAGVALGALLFSLARSNPFHGVLYALVPGLEKARAPIMAMAVADVAIAALAAIGVDALLAGAVKRVSRIAAVVAGAAAFLFVVSLYPPAILQPAPHGAERAAAIALTAALLGLLLWAWQRDLLKPLAFVAALLGLALFEIGNSTGYDYVHLEDKASIVRPRLYGGTEELAAFLRGHMGASRMTYPYDDLLFNFGDWHGIAAMSGFLPSAPTALWQLGTWNPRVLDLYGVRYYVAREPVAGLGPEVFSGDGGWKVWERSTAFPRAWVVHGVTEGGAGKVLDPAIDLRQTVVMERPVAVEGCGGGEPVEVRTPDENHVTLDATLQCAGIVVLSDNWFPGWKATVDGWPAKVLIADAALRGVAVPGGRHRIEFTYAPGAVAWGGMLSAATLLLLGVMVSRRVRDGGAGQAG